LPLIIKLCDHWHFFICITWGLPMCDQVVGTIGEKGWPFVATLTLGSRPKQKGCKVAGQEGVRESRQRGCKGAGQKEARESHHIFPGV
jgi:hypothetical protein